MEFARGDFDERGSSDDAGHGRYIHNASGEGRVSDLDKPGFGGEETRAWGARPAVFFNSLDNKTLRGCPN